jgi:hypothetical protein
MSDDGPEGTWKPIPGLPGYEADWDGNFRSVDRVSPSGRHLKGKPIPVREAKNGYGLVDFTGPDGKRVTRQSHVVTLTTFAGPCPEGMEACHLNDRGMDNRWRPGSESESRDAGGNLVWGNKADQWRHAKENGRAKPQVEATYECLNRCGQTVAKEGRRCLPCVQEAGRDIGRRLSRGENLLRVNEIYGYTSIRWTLRIAREYGGWKGTEAQALSQGRTPAQRVMNTFRSRLRRDAPSPPQPRDPATGALRAVSQQAFRGQSRTNADLNVAERDHREVARNTPKVTESDHHPYPADSVWNRPERTRGRTTGRSR